MNLANGQRHGAADPAVLDKLLLDAFNNPFYQDDMSHIDGRLSFKENLFKIFCTRSQWRMWLETEGPAWGMEDGRWSERERE
jgi:hypothetical protein